VGGDHALFLEMEQRIPHQRAITEHPAVRAGFGLLQNLPYGFFQLGIAEQMRAERRQRQLLADAVTLEVDAGEAHAAVELTLLWRSAPAGR
jgi:hypothetical protein